jgi:hypothetical protein
LGGLQVGGTGASAAAPHALLPGSALVPSWPTTAPSVEAAPTPTTGEWEEETGGGSGAVAGDGGAVAEEGAWEDPVVMVKGVPKPLSAVTEEDEGSMTVEEYTVRKPLGVASSSSPCFLLCSFLLACFPPKNTHTCTHTQPILPFSLFWCSIVCLHSVPACGCWGQFSIAQARGPLHHMCPVRLLCLCAGVRCSLCTVQRLVIQCSAQCGTLVGSVRVIDVMG